MRASSDVLAMVEALNLKSNSTSEAYNAASISSVLSGLRNMNDNTTAIHDILKTVLCRMEEADNTVYFQPKELANAMAGLLEMSSNSKNLLKIVSRFAGKAAQCRETFSSIDLALCLYGLKVNHERAMISCYKFP